jgi:hypothetical protein
MTPGERAVRSREEGPMKNSWAARVLVGLACAGAMACGGSDGANDDRPRNSASRASSPDTAAAAIVSLSGCLEAAPGTDRYVLRNVRFEPRAEGDSQRTTTTPGGHGITEGAWVRLDRGETNLQDLLGQRVRLTGAVTDDERSGPDGPRVDGGWHGGVGTRAGGERHRRSMHAALNVRTWTFRATRALDDRRAWTGRRTPPPLP